MLWCVKDLVLLLCGTFLFRGEVLLSEHVSDALLHRRTDGLIHTCQLLYKHSLHGEQMQPLKVMRRAQRHSLLVGGEVEGDLF